MLYYVDGLQDNLSRKFRQQIDAARSLGYDVWYLGCNEHALSLYHNEHKYDLIELSSQQRSGLWGFSMYNRIYQAIHLALKIQPHFDYVYARSMYFMRSSCTALARLRSSGSRIVMEIPTYPPTKEYRAEPRLLWRSALLFAHTLSVRLARYVDLYVLIGESSDVYCGKPAINIQNGIDVLSVPIKNPGQQADCIHVLAVARMSQWHGYDRLIEGLHRYRAAGGSRPVVFHFVGPDGDGSLAKWKRLSESYGLDEWVLFEGPKYGDDLSAYFDGCSIGVASLGLHRLGIGQACVLKIREYMARGLPFIFSTTDQALETLEQGSDFFLKVGDDESPVDINQLIRFADRVQTDPSIHKRMRGYALRNMTWEGQLQKIFDRLQLMIN